VSFATPQPEDDCVISQQRELGEANSSARRILAKVTPCLARLVFCAPAQSSSSATVTQGKRFSQLRILTAFVGDFNQSAKESAIQMVDPDPTTSLQSQSKQG
jgi:hypothetical protein